MKVEELVKDNKTYNIFQKEAIQKVQNLIENNEGVLYALVSNISISENNSINFKKQNKIFGGAMQFKNVLSGVIVITDMRIIFCNSALGTTNEKQIMIKDIQSIDEHISGITKTGELRIVGITDTFVVKILRKGLNEEVKKAINKARSLENNNIGNIVSSADEIRKYKKLYEDGIITLEEFENKKRDLLK